jgi:T5SS/PEP-CTERM-associated repeat protein
MRTARKLVPSAALAIALMLPSGDGRTAQAAIIVTGFGADLSLHAAAQGGGGPGDEDEVLILSPPGSTSFSPSPAPVHASESGTIGTGTSSAAGSANASYTLINDELTFQATASFDSRGSFSLAGSQMDPFASAGGSGSFGLGLSISTTGQPYEYSYSGEVTYDIGGSAGGSRASFARIRLGDNDPDTADLNLEETHFGFGSAAFPISGSGTLSGIPFLGDGLGLDISLSNIAVFSGAEAGGQSFSKGTLNFQFTLSPVPPSIRWKDPLDGSFHVAGNWESQQVPGASDMALFDEPGMYTVFLDEDVTNRRLRAAGAGVDVTLDADGVTYTADEIIVADGATLTFDGTDGGPVSVASLRGVAEANADAERQFVANAIEFTNGGRGIIKAPTRIDRVLVDAPDESSLLQDLGVLGPNGSLITQRLAVGKTAFGGIDISGGGVIAGNIANGSFAAGDLVVDLGVNAGSAGLAYFTGSGSMLHCRGLFVGVDGTGSLFISNGASVAAMSELSEVSVAIAQGSSGMIDVNGSSSLLTAKFMSVGVLGKGILTVKAGGKVTAFEIGINGPTNDETDGVTVSEMGELRVDSNIRVGAGGRLTVGNNGLVENKSVEPAAASNTGSRNTRIDPLGKITVSNGGRFHEHRILALYGELRIEGSGTVLLGQGAPIAGGTLTVGPGGLLLGNGTIFGSVKNLGGFTDLFTGTISPSNSTGTLTIEGEYEQTSGLLEIEIGGTAPGEFDVLKVAGDANILGGELLLAFVDGFAPRQGDVFKFLDVGGSLDMAFDNVEVSGLLPGFQFDLRPDAGGLAMVALNDGVAVPEPGTALLILAAACARLPRRRTVRESRGLASARECR